MEKKGSITVIDVAKKAGVSKSTVSLVLTNSDKVSERSRQKVKKAIKQTGYVYNRDAASLRSRRSNLVAIVINDLKNPYSAQLTVALEQQIQAIGKFAVLVNSSESVDKQTQLIEQLEEYNVAAYVICPAPDTSADFINQLVNKGRKVISIMREVEGAKVTTILPDNVAGTRMSTKFLLDKGYKKIAFIGGNSHISDYHQRRAGYVDSMLSYGYTIDSDKQIIESDTTRNGGRQAMKTLLAMYSDVEAVVCFTDVIAYGAIEYMKSQHIVPGQDIGIVGFDDLRDSQLMSPPLTTVHIDAKTISRMVSQEIANTDDSGTNTVLVGVDLVKRASC